MQGAIGSSDPLAIHTSPCMDVSHQEKCEAQHLAQGHFDMQPDSDIKPLISYPQLGSGMI